MFFCWNFHASDLEASKNKPHQIRVLEFQAKEHSKMSTMQVRQLQATLIQPVSIKTQNIKVVDICLGVPYHLESSQLELG